MEEKAIGRDFELPHKSDFFIWIIGKEGETLVKGVKLLVTFHIQNRLK